MESAFCRPLAECETNTKSSAYNKQFNFEPLGKIHGECVFLLHYFARPSSLILVEVTQSLKYKKKEEEEKKNLLFLRSLKDLHKLHDVFIFLVPIFKLFTSIFS